VQLLPALVTRRRSWTVALVLAGVTWCGWSALHRSLERRLQGVVQAIDQTDPGWRLEDIQTARAQVPDAENAALVVLEVASALPPELRSEITPAPPAWPQARIRNDM